VDKKANKDRSICRSLKKMVINLLNEQTTKVKMNKMKFLPD